MLLSYSFCGEGIRSGLDLYLDAGDQGIGGISDDAIGRGYASGDFNRLTEITTDLNLSQFDHAVGAHDGDLQTFRAKQQRIGGQGQTRAWGAILEPHFAIA